MDRRELIFWDTAKVLEVTKLSLSGLKQRIKLDNFPKPIKLGIIGKENARSTGVRYIGSEVMHYMEHKVNQSRAIDPYFPTYDPNKKPLHANPDEALKRTKSLIRVIEENFYSFSQASERQTLDLDSFLWGELKRVMTELVPHALDAGRAFGLDVGRSHD